MRIVRAVLGDCSQCPIGINPGFTIQICKLFRAMKVALLIAFNGTAFCGNAFQPAGGLTVEGALLDGLQKLGYVKADKTIKDIELERAGRTDAGVSAECMLYTVCLSRSIPEAPQFPLHNPRTINGLKASPLEPSSIYISAMGPATCLVFHFNRVLPPQIRVLGVMTALPENFSPRHSCAAREYEYILGYNIPLDLCTKANSAAQRFLGSNSFHNFCYWEKDQELVYNRQVYCSEVYIRENICIFHVVGSAFLYHQVRYMASMLAHIIAGLERESIIEYLLTTEQLRPRRSFPLLPSQYLTFKCGWYHPPMGSRSFYCSTKAYEELVKHVLANTGFQRSLLGYKFENEPLPVFHTININKKIPYQSLEQLDNHNENNTVRTVKS